jgi:thiosulfate dehydrogenase
MARIRRIDRTTLFAAVALVVGIAVGAGAGYVMWGWPKDWYAFRDPTKLPPGPDRDLIEYGLRIVVDTASTIGPLASDPALRFAGNKLACTNCHLNAGLQPFAAPYVSSFASYPQMVKDSVETLPERLNGCMTNSMNGKPMPEDGREMNALVAYIQYLGQGTPEGVRVAGMGMLPLPKAAETPDATRGQAVFGSVCAKCHGADGQGRPKEPPGVGYAIPPLWGDDSFNAAAGMNWTETAAAFIRANMPRGIDYRSPVLTVQQARDVAAFVTSRPRPPAPAAGQ